nr:MAG TPA: hypothetical protein [Caudoviricetes sp.]
MPFYSPPFHTTIPHFTYFVNATYKNIERW